MGESVIQVDAFTAHPGAGNPAAIGALPAPAEGRWMQEVARAMSLAEPVPPHRGDDGFRPLWSAPAAEVDLLGHATPVAVHVLWEGRHLPPGRPARLHRRTRSCR